MDRCRVHKCRTNLLINIPLHFSLNCEQDPEVLELLCLVQDLLHNPEKALYLFPSETMASYLQVLILIPAALHSAAYRSSESWRWRDWWSQQDQIIYKEQRPNPEVTKPDPLHTMAAPNNSVHRSYDQNQWQMAALTGNASNVLPAMQTTF